jgi:hypothetical protein
MKRIEDSTHYHEILNFEELKAVLTAEKVRMNSDSIDKEANII